MKKILLSAMAATAMLSASALTGSDFTGKTMAIMLNGNGFQLSFPVACGASGVTANGNSLKVNNFYDGLPANMSISGTKLIFSDFNGGYSPYFPNPTIGMITIAKNYMYTVTIDGEQAPVMCWEMSTDASFGNFESLSNASGLDMGNGITGWGFGTFQGNGDKMLLLEYYDVTNGTANAELLDIQGFNGMQIYTYPTNSTVTEYAENGMVSDMYGVNVDIKDGKITLRNFLNQGISAKVDVNTTQYSLGFVTGDVDLDNGTVYIPIQIIAGDVDYGFIGDGSNEDAFLGNGTLLQDGPSGYWFLYSGTMYYPWQLINTSSYNSQTGEATGIEGTIETGAASHDGTTAWVSHGGDCKTTSNTIITLDSPGVYGAYYDDIIGGCSKMEIATPMDVTASVGLRIIKSNYWGNTGTATGMITESANTQNVDHFDIYAVEGNFSTINDNGFADHIDLGHANAVKVYDGSAESDLEYAFTASFNHGNGDNNGEKDMTYFVKTIYTPESGLQPTFHAMYNIKSSNAVEDITDADLIEIAAANGAITIAGTDADATVYNAAGATIYSGASRNISVANGVYVVKVGGKVAKVLVK